MITLSIDVDKIDKTRFYEKNGKRYLNLVLFESDGPDRFGNDYIVKHSSTKEERTKRVQLPIIGNGKKWADRRPSATAAATGAGTSPQDDDSIPF